MEKIILYSKIGCDSCNSIKMLLRKDRIDFIEVNLSEDKESLERVRNAGLKYLPVVEVGNKLFSITPMEYYSLKARLVKGE